MAKKKVTSSQVAEKAGVSQATVSMILNRRNNVSFSEETIEKVERAARELGYELPHRKHKNNSKKEKLIVVFCPTLTSPYYVLLLQGIESVANEKGYGVFICNTQRDARLEERYLRMIGNIEPQGIIYACNPHPDFQQKVEELARRIPLVIISNKEKTTTVDAINQDNTMVGRLMAETSSGSGTQRCGIYHTTADQKAVATIQKNRWFCKRIRKRRTWRSCFDQGSR